MKKRQVIIISIASACVLLLTSVLIYFCGIVIPRKIKDEENSRLWEEYYQQKISHFQEENKILENVDVVFIGDSLTEGYDVENYYSEYNVVNRGIGGDRTYTLEDRLQVSLFDLQPKVAVMLIGGNNLGTMFDDYENIIIKLKNNLPQSDVIILSLTALGKSLKDKNALVQKNNKEIFALAKKYNLHYIDLFSPLYDSGTGEIVSEYTTDGAHLTEKGYDVLTGQIKPVIDEIL